MILLNFIYSKKNKKILYIFYLLFVNLYRYKLFQDTHNFELIETNEIQKAYITFSGGRKSTLKTLLST